MKRAILIFTVLVLTLSSCAAGAVVSYIEAEGEKQYDNVTDVTVCEGESVIFYADETLLDVAVRVMTYDESLEDYVENTTLISGKTLETDEVLRITLDLDSEMPYVCVSYTRENGKTRQQFIYRDSNGKLWLLEQQ